MVKTSLDYFVSEIVDVLTISPTETTIQNKDQEGSYCLTTVKLKVKIIAALLLFRIFVAFEENVKVLVSLCDQMWCILRVNKLMSSYELYKDLMTE